MDRSAKNPVILRHLAGAAVAGLWGVSVADASDAPSLTDLVQTYNGAPKRPGFSVPSGMTASFSYTYPGPVLFRRQMTDIVDVWKSYSFELYNFRGVGDLLVFDDSEPTPISEVEVSFSSWTKAAEFPDWAAENSEGYLHPIRIYLYSVGENYQLTYIADAEQEILVPWVPLTYPDGSNYDRSAFPFRATVRFDEPVEVPERTMVLVTYNTESAGFQPLGVRGPYNKLNIGFENAETTVGTDEDSNSELWVFYDPETNTDTWGYPARIAGTPLFKISGPRTVSSTAPTDAGVYGVEARFESVDSTVEIHEDFTILRAPATIAFWNEEPVVDGNQKPIFALTDPPGLPLEISYGNTPIAPRFPGLYDVGARIVSPNHHGEAQCDYRLGYDFSGWLANISATQPLPLGEDGPEDDPDGDGLTNWFEFVFQGNPLEPEAISPRLISRDGDLVFRFRRNPEAVHVSLAVQTTATPHLPGTWVPMDGGNFVVDQADPSWVWVDVVREGARRFYRLSAKPLGE